MEGAVRGLPGRIDRERVGLVRLVARRARQAMKRHHDALLPGGIAVENALAKTNLGEQTARFRELGEILRADRRRIKSAQIALANKTVIGRAVERLAHRIEADAITLAELA